MLQCWPFNLRIKTSHYLMKAPKFAKSLVRFILYICLFRYFLNILSYVYELEQGFIVDECHYCLNSRTRLKRQHYTMLPHHCIVLVSLRLFRVRTNISTHFKASSFTTLYHTFTVWKMTFFFEFLRYC